MALTNGYQHVLIAAYAAQVRTVRADYGNVVTPTVDKFAWERVQSACTPEKVADARWATDGAVFIRFVILDEILMFSKLQKRRS